MDAWWTLAFSSPRLLMRRAGRGDYVLRSIALAAALALVACEPLPGEYERAGVTRTPATGIPTSTPQPAATSTQAPTAAPAATPTPIPTPIPTPTQAATAAAMTLSAYNETCGVERYHINELRLAEWYDLAAERIRMLEPIVPPPGLRHFHSVRLQRARKIVDYLESRGANPIDFTFLMLEQQFAYNEAVGDLPWEIRSQIKRCWP